MAYLKLYVFIVVIFIKKKVFGTVIIDSKVYKEVSHYCKVKDRALSHEFDFTTLSDDSSDRKIHLNDHEFLKVQFCGPLVTKCNGQDGYSVCLTQANGEEIGAGRDPPKIDITHGKITFNYVGNECNNTHTYTIVFEMQCDVLMVNETAIDKDNLYERGQCDFYMVLLTSAACPKNRRVDCTLTHESNHYDLSLLTDLTDNYVIGLNNNVSVVLNVCHSLHSGRRPICEADTAICLVDQTDKFNISYKSLGKIEESTRILIAPNGHVSIDYKNGGICDFDPTRKIRSSILFICDLSGSSSVPIYTLGWDKCRYDFIWTTIAACSKEALFQESQKYRKDCAIKDPITNFEYDLTALENRIFKSRKGRGNYEISVCGPLRGSNCFTGTGVCREKDSQSPAVSGGLANGNLMWREEGPYLNYTNGDVCSNGQRRYTILSFSCDENNYLDFYQEKPCHTIISWNTNFACKKTCAISNEINFNNLTRSTSNYIIRADHNTEYHINVCHALVPKNYLECNYGSGICKVTLDKSGRIINETNIGFASHNLRMLHNKTVILSYHNGSVCEENPDKNVSSHISFLCFQDVQEGTPKFKFYSNCEYHFEWKTKLSCGKVESIFDKNKCSVFNSLDDFWNLTTLYQQSMYQVMSSVSHNKFTMNFCGRTHLCNGSYICDENMNYGSDVSVKYDYTKNVLEFEYTNGSKCSDGSNSRSSLRMICNKSAGFGMPVFVSEDYCSAVFEWTTSSACKLKNYVFHLTKSDYSGGTVHTRSKKKFGRIDNTAVIVTRILSAIFFILFITVGYYFRKASRRMHFVARLNNCVLRWSRFFQRTPPGMETFYM